MIGDHAGGPSAKPSCELAVEHVDGSSMDDVIDFARQCFADGELAVEPLRDAPRRRGSTWSTQTGKTAGERGAARVLPRRPTPAAEPEPQWVIEGPPQPVDLALDDAGHLVIVGHNTLVNDTTGWLRKIAPDGSELWLQDLDLQSESPVAIAVDSHARIVVVLESATETRLRKYDSAGSPLWTISPDPSRRIRDAAIDSSDGIVVAGSMDLAGPEPCGAAWVACFSP